MGIIEFPRLFNLEILINPIAFSLFGIDIRWYGIIVALSLAIATFLALRDSEKFGLKKDSILDLILFSLPAAVIGARLYYVVFNWEQFSFEPFKIINIRTGGIAIYGGIIGGMIAAYVYLKIKKINVLKMFDFLAPYLVLGQAIGRWGNFVNQEAYGTNTLLPWGMTGDIIRRDLTYLQQMGYNLNPMVTVHPTFLYESLWNIGVFLFLIWYRKRRRRRGDILCLYMIFYGIGRFFIEALRLDSLYLGVLRVSQVLAGIFIFIFSIILFMLFRGKDNLEVVERN